MADLLTTWALDSRQFQDGLRRQQNDVKRASVSVSRELSSVGGFLGRGLAGSLGGVFSAIGAFNLLRQAVADTRAEFPELTRNISLLEGRFDRLYSRGQRGLAGLLDIAAGIGVSSSAGQRVSPLLNRAGNFAFGLLGSAAFGVPVSAGQTIAQVGQTLGPTVERQQAVGGFRSALQSVNVSGSAEEQFRVDRFRIESERQQVLSALLGRGLESDVFNAAASAANELFDKMAEALNNRRLQDVLEDELRQQEEARRTQERIIKAREDRVRDEQQAQQRAFTEFQTDAGRARNVQQQLRGLNRRLQQLSTGEALGLTGGSAAAYGLDTLGTVASDTTRDDERTDILESIDDLTREQNDLLRRLVNNGFGLAP